jgi:hypothetical protein
MQQQTRMMTGLQKGQDMAVKKFTPEQQKISYIQRPGGAYNFTGSNVNYQGQYQTKSRKESGSDYSQLSLPSQLDYLLSSNDVSLKNHIQVNWDDPELSSFDPSHPNDIISQQDHPVSRQTNHELALLMEENLLEVENNFPTYQRMQTKGYHMDRELIEKVQFTNYRPALNIAPILDSTANILPQAQIIPENKELHQKGLVVESFTSFEQESESSIAELNQSKARNFTVLDLAGLDMEPQNSKDLSRQINIASDSDQPQAFNLENDMERILGSSERRIQNEPQGHGTPSLTGKVTNSTLQNNQTEEECELPNLEEDSPSRLFEMHSIRVSNSKPIRSLTASQQLFEERVPTKAGSEPVRIEPRQYREENSRTDSA